MRDAWKTDGQIGELLRFVAPGTLLRDGMENVLRAKTGGLIVVGYNEEVMRLVDGGFFINVDLMASYLYELAKMDGAIILSDDGKKILYANAQLIPDSTIPSTETGIRHRSAERMAKQTGKLVIAISQRRNVITLYQGQLKYSLKDIGVIFTKANQALQTLEKYKAVLDQTLTNLSALEFEEMVTLHEVVMVVQRIEMVLRIKQEIIRYINELGSEGRLISMQMNELVNNFEEEALSLLKDYVRELNETERESHLWEQFLHDDLMDTNAIIRFLGYSGANTHEEVMHPRGFRILNKIPRLPTSIINNLVESFLHLHRVMLATIEELDEVDGIGEVRARAIKEGLKRIQEQVFLERHI